MAIILCFLVCTIIAMLAMQLLLCNPLAALDALDGNCVVFGLVLSRLLLLQQATPTAVIELWIDVETANTFCLLLLGVVVVVGDSQGPGTSQASIVIVFIGACCRRECHEQQQQKRCY